jgi:hypothetical protein
MRCDLLIAPPAHFLRCGTLWQDASMEGTYLPADPAYAGGTVANAFGNGWANSATTANNLGGIRGTTPANVLPLQSGWVAGPTAVGRRVQLQQRWVRNQMLAAAAPGLDMVRKQSPRAFR